MPGASDPFYALLQETVTFTPCFSDPETTVSAVWMTDRAGATLSPI